MAENKGIVNASAMRSLKDKSIEKVQELFQRVAENGCAWSNDRKVDPKKQAGFIEVGAITNFGTQLVALSIQVKLLTNRLMTMQVLVCGLCQGNHHMDQCNLTTESINFVRNFGRQVQPNRDWGIKKIKATIKEEIRTAKQVGRHWELKVHLHLIYLKDLPDLVIIFKGKRKRSQDLRRF